MRYDPCIKNKYLKRVFKAAGFRCKLGIKNYFFFHQGHETNDFYFTAHPKMLECTELNAPARVSVMEKRTTVGMPAALK